MKLEQILEGAVGHRGIFIGYKAPDAKGEIKKDAITQFYSVDWPEHFSGKKTYGLSPVKIIKNGNGSIGLVRWLGWDADLFMKPKDFCKKLFKLNTQFFPYQSSSGRWHIHLYLDDWLDVVEGKKIAQEIEKQLIKVFPKNVAGHIDTSHTVPSGFTIDKGKPGGWLFAPYSNNKELKNPENVCYSPRGNKLSKAQVEFRHKVRKSPLVSSMVGATAGEGGRANFLFYAAQEIKQSSLNITLREVNDNFNEPLGEPDFNSEERHIEKSLSNEEEFTKEYLKEHYETYLEKVNGFWRKAKAPGVLGDFGDDEETEEKKIAFFDDTIFMKYDVMFYSKKTGLEYKEKTIKISAGHLFKDPIKSFAADEDRKQEVEMGVYRPDLFKSIEDPIVTDEDGLKQLNIYRPGLVEPMPADTPLRKKELQMFLDLVSKLTENEEYGFTSKGKKIKLYDYVLDHLTMYFRYPGTKVRSAILMHSELNQVGKGIMFLTIRAALGTKNADIITPENAARREKAFLQNQVVLIDEILIDGDFKKKISILNIFKTLMTSEIHDCRPLFKESRPVFSTCNFMLFTNHKEAISISETDERYTVIDVNKSRDQMGGSDFFHTYWEQLKPSGTGTLKNVVKHYLMNREVSENFEAAGVGLKTEFLKTMSEHGGHPLYSTVKILYKEGSEPFNNSIISISDAWDYLRKEEKLKGSLNEFSDCLSKIGCRRIGESKHRQSGKSPILYMTKNFEFFDGMSNSEIASKYWLPLNFQLFGVASSQYSASELKYKMGPPEINIVKNHLEEIKSYESMMEPEDPNVIKIDEVTDIPEEIKKHREAEENPPCYGDGEMK